MLTTTGPVSRLRGGTTPVCAAERQFFANIAARLVEQGIYCRGARRGAKLTSVWCWTTSWPDVLRRFVSVGSGSRRKRAIGVTGMAVYFYLELLGAACARSGCRACCHWYRRMPMAAGPLRMRVVCRSVARCDRGDRRPPCDRPARAANLIPRVRIDPRPFGEHLRYFPTERARPEQNGHRAPKRSRPFHCAGLWLAVI